MASGPPWQWALYVFALGMVCTILIPLTDAWWIAALLGAIVPIAVALVGERRDGHTDRSCSEALEQPADHPLPDRPAPASTAARWSVADCPVPTTAPERSRQDVVARTPGVQTRGHAVGTSEFLPPGVAETGRYSLLEPLSERELEVLSVLASGRTTAETARDLFVSVGTIKSHTGNIYRKLGAKNRTEAVARARTLGLLP